MAPKFLIPAKIRYPTGQFDPRSPRLVALFTNFNPESPARRKFGLMGIPYDGAIPTRPGARSGPDGIRNAFFGLTNFDGEVSVDPSTPLVTDFGDVIPAVGNTAETHLRVEECVRFVSAWCDLPIFLGGDHSLTYPCFKAILEEGEQRLGLIVFDAHHDVRDYSQKVILSGTPFRRIIELAGDRFSPTNLVQIGIRPFANSRPYQDWLKESGAVFFTTGQIQREGIEKVVERAIEVAFRDTDAVYLSIDIDVLDQAFAPGVSAAAPGGLTFRELYFAVRTITERTTLAAVDVMEVSPLLDYRDQTSRVAAHLIAGIIFSS